MGLIFKAPLLLRVSFLCFLIDLNSCNFHQKYKHANIHHKGTLALEWTSTTLIDYHRVRFDVPIGYILNIKMKNLTSNNICFFNRSYIYDKRNLDTLFTFVSSRTLMKINAYSQPKWYSTEGIFNFIESEQGREEIKLSPGDSTSFTPFARIFQTPSNLQSAKEFIDTLSILYSLHPQDEDTLKKKYPTFQTVKKRIISKSKDYVFYVDIPKRSIKDTLEKYILK